MANHVCHVNRCGARVPPTMLMCADHWRRVPKALRSAVQSSYRRGQCHDKRPSTEWLKAARSAIKAVEAGDSPAPWVPR